MLKPSGLFCFTCASTNRREHGTRTSGPRESYGTIGNIEDMYDYYKNLTVSELNEVLQLDNTFSTWETYYNSSSCDLYFIGIKNGSNDLSISTKYSESSVTCTTTDI